MTFIDIVVTQWQQQSPIEICAMLLALAYIWLAGQQSFWCWPAGLLSTALYAYVYWDVSLMFQMLLNVYYMLIAVWGFYAWRRKGEQAVVVTTMKVIEHVVVVASAVVISISLYFIATVWLHFDITFELTNELIALDVSLSVFSVIATYLTLSKRLESWIYWSCINFSSIFLLWQKDLYLTIVLMLVYIVLAVRGYRIWNRAYVERRAI